MSEKQQEKGHLVAIKDLPIYTEPPKLSEYRFVEKDPVIGEHLFRQMRHALRNLSGNIKMRLGMVNESLEPVKEVASATEDYIRKEKDLFPKAAAITLGGMAGFVIGMRGGRGRMRKYIYAIGGLLTMSAFCYPHDTIHVVRTGIAHAQRTWEDFQKAPEPERKSKS